MELAERYKRVMEQFALLMPDAQTELHYQSAFQLLVAVILSAQCTDRRVNMVTPALFERFPTAESMAEVDDREVFKYISSISYPNNKARNLVGMAKMVCERFGGAIPDTIDELVELPGVGRKTANVMGVVLFDRQVMPVDTHVFRVSNRIGLTVNAKNPLQTEKQLEANIDKELISKAHHWLILHGRYVCTARKPHCEECGIREWCQYYENNFGDNGGIKLDLKN